MRQPEPVLRCSPAGFDVGSDRSGCDGWFDEFAIYFIISKFIVDGGACGYVGEGEHFLAFRAGSASRGKRSRSATPASRASSARRSEELIPRSLTESSAMLSWRGAVAGGAGAGRFLMLLPWTMFGSSWELRLKPRSISR